jgi:hypothetical protein
MLFPPQQHITGAVIAVVLQLVAVLRAADGHRERRLGEQPAIAAPAEIHWASGAAGAEVVTNMEPEVAAPACAGRRFIGGVRQHIRPSKTPKPLSETVTVERAAARKPEKA